MGPSRAAAHVTRWGLVVALGVVLVGGGGAASASKVVILATTTSTQDSGLLDVLVPLFEKRTGLAVKTIAVGTGQALALAAKGEADVTLAHAPALEKRYVGEGKLLNRRLVMANDFVLLGPADDPARVGGMKRVVEALRRIAESGAPFVSRGDQSGTHLLERALWEQVGTAPRGDRYLEAGQGMGATLGIAADRRAYTLADRGTWLAFRTRLPSRIMVEDDPALLNLYSVLEVNPRNGPRVNAEGGRRFADFLVSTEAQAVIRTFGLEKHGEPLFRPMAGKSEDALGG